MLYYLTLCLLSFVHFLSLHAENVLTNESLCPSIYELEITNETPHLQFDLDCKKDHDKSKEISKESPTIDQFSSTLSAECEPLATVAGCVNVASGSFFQIDHDLKGTTIDPLDFIRYYDSSSEGESFLGFEFGSGFPLWGTGVEKGALWTH